MRLSQDDTSWKCRGIKKRDFRHTHDGPEVAAWKKKKRKKTRNKKHLHTYIFHHQSWYYKCGQCSVCGKKNYQWTR